jgi:hypothetical protein
MAICHRSKRRTVGVERESGGPLMDELRACQHKQLQKQLVGGSSWYMCAVCPRKFKAEMWDGKVTVVQPVPAEGAQAGMETIMQLRGALATAMMFMRCKEECAGGQPVCECGTEQARANCQEILDAALASPPASEKGGVTVTTCPMCGLPSAGTSHVCHGLAHQSGEHRADSQSTSASTPASREPTEELLRKMAERIHFKLAAAQNLPYEDGDTCSECEDFAKELAALAPPSTPASKKGDWPGGSEPFPNEGEKEFMASTPASREPK